MALLIAYNTMLGEEAVVEYVSPTVVRWKGQLYDLDKAGRLIGSGGWKVRVKRQKTEE